MSPVSSITRRTFSRGLSAAVLGLWTTPVLAGAAAGSPGFRGRIVTEWLPDGRQMRLVEPIEYHAVDSKVWMVPAGTIVDGASIPEVFWSIIGGPFEGLYRGPSVVHDHFCETRTRPASAVHGVFHEAMLTSGVGKRRAWLMYQAVTRFGPRWADPVVSPDCDNVSEAYDFEKCAMNSAKPPLIAPKASREDLMRFSEEMAGAADDGDLAKLREAVR